MPFITFTVEGLEEIINRLNSLDLQMARTEALQEVSDFMANEMRNNAHVITGQMKASISSSVTGDTATVEVLAPYAAFENARVGGIQGPHDFADRAVQSTTMIGPDMVKRAYNTAVMNM
jgi:Bacteriophage protein of unknown function (DUF646).